MSRTLSYFDFNASRGLECRLALTLAGLPFEDHRVSREQWHERKPTTPFGAMPVLNPDGRVLAQSTAILTYIGRGHGLHPTDPWRAAQHEAVMASVEDLRSKVPGGSAMSQDDKRDARQAFAAGWLQQWAATVSDTIAGPFLDGDQLHVADLRLYTVLRALHQGSYDFLDWSVLADWPKIQALYRAVDADPRVVTGLGHVAGQMASDMTEAPCC